MTKTYDSRMAEVRKILDAYDNPKIREEIDEFDRKGRAKVGEEAWGKEPWTIHDYIASHIMSVFEDLTEAEQDGRVEISGDDDEEDEEEAKVSERHP